MPFYMTIEGVKYDAEILELANILSRGSGDSNLCISDAELLLGALMDRGQCTEMLKNTVDYLRRKFDWTETGREWFRTEVRQWMAT